MRRGVVACAAALAAVAPICLLVAGAIDFAVTTAPDRAQHAVGLFAARDEARLPVVAAGGADASDQPELHPVVIRHPSTLGVLDTELRDVRGTPVGVACGTCHAAAGGKPAIAEREGAPKGFHLGIELSHGTLSCNSCHHPADRTRLRLADGTSLAAAEVMQLCGQCHGPQLRDYQRGSHGGMAGYWDRERGPQVRNSCEVCHAAHAPAYPTVIPAPPPRDRFLPQHPEPRPSRPLPGGAEPHGAPSHD